MNAILAERVAAIRAFNRFYTESIGVLTDGLLQTHYSLTEARVLFELAQRKATEVAELRNVLALDAGYLSRILARFEKERLVVRQQSASDRRRQLVELTERGQSAFELLDMRSAGEIEVRLSKLTEEDQQRLIKALGVVRGVLEQRPPAQPYLLRPLYPGDIGWVIHRHGVRYAQEYGWDETFESLVARILADYADRRDTKREAGWIAEVDGAPVGCIFCMRKDDQTAQLRLLLVEQAARGMGIGSRLVDECLSFARRAGYREITLWTNDVLAAARRIYERAGFQLAEQEAHHSFGHDLVGQYWTRTLS